MPLQEYFLNRRTNPEQLPKYVAVRITQEDARLYENVLSCCYKGCLDAVVRAGAFEEGFEGARAGVDEIVEHGSGYEKRGDVSVNPDLVSHAHSRGCSSNDVEEEEGSGEDAPESGIWIMATAESN
jgi:hypothetical protein